MYALIKLNMYNSIRLRDSLAVTVVFLMLTLAHASLAFNYQQIYSVPISLSDFLLISMGGILINETFWKLFGWVGSLLPILFFVYRLTAVTGYDLHLFTRMKRRVKWWVAKMASLSLYAVFYSLWYLMVHLLIGGFVFSASTAYRPLYHENLPNIVQLGMSPFELLGWVLLLFMFGLLSIAAIAHTIALQFHNSTSVYAIYTIYLFVSGAFVVQGSFVKWLAPVFYPSFITLFQAGHDWSVYLRSLSFNMLLIILFSFVSIAVIRKKPI